MRILLDTHTFIWFIEGNSRISPVARAMIEDENNEKLVSTASLWEMAIKSSIGKLPTRLPFASIIPQQIDNNGFEILPVATSHIIAISTLPLHHRDPFDRMLIAQAMTEALPIVSADVAFDAYTLQRIW